LVFGFQVELWSLLYGAVVLGLLFGAIVFVSQRDRVRRR